MCLWVLGWIGSRFILLGAPAGRCEVLASFGLRPKLRGRYLRCLEPLTVPWELANFIPWPKGLVLGLWPGNERSENIVMLQARPAMTHFPSDQDAFYR